MDASRWSSGCSLRWHNALWNGWYVTADLSVVGGIHVGGVEHSRKICSELRIGGLDLLGHYDREPEVSADKPLPQMWPVDVRSLQRPGALVLRLEPRPEAFHQPEERPESAPLFRIDIIRGSAVLGNCVERFASGSTKHLNG